MKYIATKLRRPLKLLYSRDITCNFYPRGVVPFPLLLRAITRHIRKTNTLDSTINRRIDNKNGISVSASSVTATNNKAKIIIGLTTAERRGEISFRIYISASNNFHADERARVLFLRLCRA